MPGFDGTGPLGQGPRTGGGFGVCPPGVGPALPTTGGGVLYGVGRGGWPRGGGRGRCFGGGRGRWAARPFWGLSPRPVAWQAPAPPQETEMLKRQAEIFEGQLDTIRKRLDELAAAARAD